VDSGSLLVTVAVEASDLSGARQSFLAAFFLVSFFTGFSTIHLLIF